MVVSSGTGLNHQFDDTLVANYGITYRTTATASYTFNTPGILSNTSNLSGDSLIYHVRNDAGVETGMPTTEDWVLQIVCGRMDNTTAAGKMWEIATPANQNMFHLDIYAGGSIRLYYGGDFGPEYVTLPANTWNPDGLHTFTLHYKAATTRLDFWMDDTILLADFQSEDGGTYDYSRSPMRGPINYDSWVAGPLVPEPMTLGLLALGGLGLIRRRK